MLSQYSFLICFAFVIRALADVYSLTTTIPFSPTAPTLVDQSIVFNGTYYLADRTNSGVHVISLSNDTQTKLITGFHTRLINGNISSAVSGPNGLVVLPDRNELYVGDGDGSVKVISLVTNTIITNISTGFNTRADEMAYDPTNKIVVVTNPSETLITASIINATSRTILGNISFSGAVALEQPAFNPSDGRFYFSVPFSKTYPSGSLAILNVSSMSIEKFIAVPSCLNAGIVFDTSNHVFIGCSQLQFKSFGFAASYIMDATTGSIISNISSVSGSDQVTYSSSTGWFYAAAFQEILANGTANPNVAIIAANGTLLQTIATDDTVAHSLAVDEASGRLVVPVKGKGIQVYKLVVSNAGGGPASGTSSPGMASATSVGRGLIVNGFTLLVAGIVWALLL